METKEQKERKEKYENAIKVMTNWIQEFYKRKELNKKLQEILQHNLFTENHIEDWLELQIIADELKIEANQEACEFAIRCFYWIY